MPLVYIMAGISLALPVLILVMTSMLGSGEEGAETAEMFTNTWQAIGSMDITGMCNINLLYFLVALFLVGLGAVSNLVLNKTSLA